MNCKPFFIFLALASSQTSFSQMNDTAAARLNNYRDKVFTIFNKCNNQDEAITNAIKAKDIKEIESGRQAILQCSTDGMKAVTAIGSFDGDPSLKFSCSDVLKFYKQVAESDLPLVRDFFIEEENFAKVKNEFEKFKRKNHSETEILAYNNEVKKHNAAITRYKQVSDFIASGRKLTLYNWNASLKLFMDGHRKSG